MIFLKINMVTNIPCIPVARHETNGLFDISANYTLGIGSEYGKGYIVDIQLVTLEKVETEVRDRIEQDVLTVLNKELPVIFPGQKLKAVKVMLSRFTVT